MQEIGDISIQVHSQGNLVAEGSGLPATMRRTIEQGAGALMWSVRMIGVALAFLAPWIIALAAAIGIARASAAPVGIGRIRNTGHRPVRQADILSAFPCAKQRSGTPLGAQTRRSVFRRSTTGPSCSKHSSIVK